MAPKNNYDPTPSGDMSNMNVQEDDLREMEDVEQSLDALSCALDAVEQRTDDILSQLRELLDSNREIRRQLAQEAHNATEEQKVKAEGGDKDDDMASRPDKGNEPSANVNSSDTC